VSSYLNILNRPLKIETVISAKTGIPSSPNPKPENAQTANNVPVACQPATNAAFTTAKNAGSQSSTEQSAPTSISTRRSVAPPLTVTTVFGASLKSLASRIGSVS
jgi:hypothetical protein